MSHNTHEQLPSPRSSGQQSGAARGAPKRWAAVAALLTLALGQVAPAVDGRLDPAFGPGGPDGDGLVTFDVNNLGNLGDQLFGVAILPDGRIAVGGFTGLTGTTGEPLSGDLDFVVGAFRGVNGSLDTGFGTGGLTITDISGPQSEDVANALVLQNDGKIVLVGRSSPNDSPRFAAVRYRADGQPDTGFGDNGMVETPAPGPGSPESNARDVAVQTDGKIILAGVVGSDIFGEPSSRTGDIALVRYNRDGSLDDNDEGGVDDGGLPDATPGDRFGSDGTVRTSFGASNFAFALAVAVQDDGKIVAGGEVDPGPPDRKVGDFVLVRYNRDGSLDDNDEGSLDDAGLADSTPGDKFGDNGTVSTDFGRPIDRGELSDDTVRDLVLQPDGKIVAGGTANSGGGASQFVLARYNVDGTLDPTFGTGGTKTTPFPGAGGSMAALVRQQGGKLVAAGTAAGGGREASDFALVRYQPNGHEDTTFGEDKVDDDGDLGGEGVPDGFTITRFEPGRNAAEGQDVVLDAEGKIVVAGFFRREPSAARLNDFALARYQSSVIPEDITCQGHPATVIGTPGGDILVGTQGNDVIHGLEGDDIITARGGDDIVCGGPGDDEVLGGPGGDAIEGGEGDDRLFGAAGDDRLFGDAGNDTLVGDDPFAGTGGSDVLRGGEGNDMVFGAAGDDQLFGDGGTDELVGGPGDDMLLNGGPGDDRVFGEGGADILAGDAGNDTLVGDTLPSDAAAGPDVLRGGEGDDTLFGAAGDDRLFGDGGRDELDGGPGNDQLDGGPGNDRKLFGGDGNDTIRGGPGRFKDRLVGGAGRDELRGGPGNDRLFGGAGRDRLLGEAGNDVMDGERGSDSGLGGPGRPDRCFSMGPRDACEIIDGGGPRPQPPNPIPGPPPTGAPPGPTVCNFPQCDD